MFLHEARIFIGRLMDTTKQICWLSEVKYLNSIKTYFYILSYRKIGTHNISKFEILQTMKLKQRTIICNVIYPTIYC